MLFCNEFLLRAKSEQGFPGGQSGFLGALASRNVLLDVTACLGTC